MSFAGHGSIILEWAAVGPGRQRNCGQGACHHLWVHRDDLSPDLCLFGHGRTVERGLGEVGGGSPSVLT